MRIYLFVLIFFLNKLNSQNILRYDDAGGRFLAHNMHISSDSVYFYMFSSDNLKFGKFPLTNPDNKNFQTHDHLDNIINHTPTSWHGSFVRSWHIRNYLFSSQGQNRVNIAAYNFENNTCFNKLITLSSAGFDPSPVTGPSYYTASPGFEINGRICNVISDNSTCMQSALIFDDNLSNFRAFSFQIGDKYVRFRQGGIIGNFVYLLYNEYTGSSAPFTDANTILLKVDINFNFLGGIKIGDLNGYKFDFSPDNKFVITGRRVSDGNQNVLWLDDNMNYLDELATVPGLDVQVISDATSFVTYGFDKVTSTTNDYYIVSQNNAGYSVLSKLDQTLKVIWQKSIPGYASFYPLDANGGLIVKAENESLNDRLEFLQIDNTGHSDPALLDYCGTALIKNNYHRLRISNFNDVRNWGEVTFTEDIRVVNTQTDKVIFENGFFNNINPEAHFITEDTWCLSGCDTFHTTDLGVVDESYYLINNMPVDTLFCPPTTGSLDVWHYITYYGGCIDSIMKVIHVEIAPVVSLNDTAMLCDASVGVEVTATSNAPVYWNQDMQDTVLSKRFYENGWQFLTSGIGMCSVRDSVYVSSMEDLIEGWPDFFAQHDIDYCEGSTAVLNINSHDLIDLIKWNDGSIGSFLNADISGVYRVEVHADECVARDSVNVTFINCHPAQVFVPNVFSPNYDGINDILNINFENADILDFTVFNRWGIELYSETPYSGRGWDGTFRNKVADSGVYVWMVRYFDKITNKLEIIKGDVTLIL